MAITRFYPAGAARIATMAFALTVVCAAPAWAGSGCAGYSKCPDLDFPQILSSDPDAIAVSKGIKATEASALATATKAPPSGSAAQALLGTLLMFDTNLSANRDQACASCHTPGAGFTGGISSINKLSGSFPGSVQIRTGNRKPQSAAYGAFAPKLSYDGTNFTGGNFWDQRATGAVTGDPAADQAEGPFTNPLEMGLIDHACAVRRVATGAYAALVKKVWGASSLTIAWPSNTDKLCAEPNEGAANQQPVALSKADRARAEETYADLAKSLAAFERSKAVAPFSSKFDAFMAGKVELSNQELAGYGLFIRGAHCSQCHSGFGGGGQLFTNFTAQNIGIPKNTHNPYFYENLNNGAGLVANPAGNSYVDNGLGAILATSSNPTWRAAAPKFIGTFQTPTLRNVGALPRAGFVHAYMHNGYFTDLKSVVHFYNTRDRLPRCSATLTKVGVNCWPAAEQPANMDHVFTGNLGLSSAQEDDIVAFLNTLTDGYVVPATTKAAP